jgi:tetratricopeptide (TPR) repeat protein
MKIKSLLIKAAMLSLLAAGANGSANAQAVPSSLAGSYWYETRGDGFGDRYKFDFIDSRTVHFTVSGLSGGKRWIGRYSESTEGFDAQFDQYVQAHVTNSGPMTTVDFDTPQAVRSRGSLRMTGVYGRSQGGEVRLWVRTATDYAVITGSSFAFRYQKKDADWFISRGINFLDNGKHALALQDLADAIRQDPANGNAHRWRCLAYEGAKNYAAALDDCNKAVSLNAPFAFYARAGIHVAQGNQEKAIADMSKHIEMNPKDSDGFRRRAGFYLKLKDHKLALTDLTEAIKLVDSSKQPEAYYMMLNVRASMLRELGQHASALIDYTRYLKGNPKDANALNDRAWIHSRIGALDLALYDADRAIEADPKSKYAYNTRAEIYTKLSKRDLAIADYRKALELAPGDEIATKGLAALAAKP